jgi:hypothetical protein
LVRSRSGSSGKRADRSTSSPQWPSAGTAHGARRPRRL